ncbi:acyltransferase family protein [Bradyrhizobium australiense]|uniref:Acyltransferase n=1 Tax=Bradyrhizobium australiense TaxID=2721161 RepID=A0A7Y4GLV9_9BRAD|nr:acyltransferase [Bradyrhizobium australiense]NOJ38139.1 acyltransferase [Bradyrhizobium australiense]
MPPSATPTSRVEALDLLRLVAVLGVVLYHFGFWGPASHGVPQVALPWLTPIAKYGFLGVPAFFVISGFVIAYSAEGRTATGFAIARFSRIYPTFVFCMTLTFLVIVFLGPPHFDASAQWLANLFIAAPALGPPYMDTSYWSLVIEVMFYGWVALLIAAGLFPRRIDTIILVGLGITFANKLTMNAPLIEKLFLTDDSGFFAVGLLIYQFYRGRRGPILYGMLALSISTAVFQSIHKLVKLAPHTGGTFSEWAVAAICLGSIAVIFLATQVRRVPLPAGVTLAVGGLTYPLYLLHMQLGYVLFDRWAPANSVPLVVTIVLTTTLLAWAVWRYVEGPAQRWTREFLTGQASRLGWPLKLRTAVGSGAGGGAA